MCYYKDKWMKLTQQPLSWGHFLDQINIHESMCSLYNEKCSLEDQGQRSKINTILQIHKAFIWYHNALKSGRKCNLGRLHWLHQRPNSMFYNIFIRAEIEEAWDSEKKFKNHCSHFCFCALFPFLEHCGLGCRKIVATYYYYLCVQNTKRVHFCKLFDKIMHYIMPSKNATSSTFSIK